MEIRDGIKKFQVSGSSILYDRNYEAYVNQQGEILKFQICTTDKASRRKITEVETINRTEFLFYTFINSFEKLLEVKSKEEAEAFTKALCPKYADLINQKIFKASRAEYRMFKENKVILDKNGRIAYVCASYYYLTDNSKVLDLTCERGDAAFETRVNEFLLMFYDSSSSQERANFERFLCEEDKKKFLEV